MTRIPHRRLAAAAALAATLAACTPTAPATTRPEATPDAPIADLYAEAIRQAGSNDLAWLEFTRYSSGETSLYSAFRKGGTVVAVSYAGSWQRSERTGSWVDEWSFTIPADGLDIKALADKVPWDCKNESGPEARMTALPRGHHRTEVTCTGQPAWVMLDGTRVEPVAATTPQAGLEQALADAALLFDAPTVSRLDVATGPQGVTTKVYSGTTQGTDDDGEPCVLEVRRGPAAEFEVSCLGGKSLDPSVPTGDLTAAGVAAMWTHLGKPADWSYSLMARTDGATWLGKAGTTADQYRLDGTPA